MQYVDKNNVPVNEGDILFYSESEPYAESIHLVVDVDGQLSGKTIIGNTNGSYFKEENDTPILLKYYQYLPYTDGILRDATKIGNIKENPEFLTVDYADKNYPLSNYQP